MATLFQGSVDFQVLFSQLSRLICSVCSSWATPDIVNWVAQHICNWTGFCDALHNFSMRQTKQTHDWFSTNELREQFRVVGEVNLHIVWHVKTFCVWILIDTVHFYQSLVIQQVCCYVYITWASMEKWWQRVKLIILYYFYMHLGKKKLLVLFQDVL